MDIDLKTKWIAALRSGEYKQATSQLQKGDSFCCLGVLCKVAGLEISDDGGAVVLNGTTCDYAPIRDLIGCDTLHLQDLYNRNDGHNGCHQHSFAEIADHIERTL